MTEDHVLPELNKVLSPTCLGPASVDTADHWRRTGLCAEHAGFSCHYFLLLFLKQYRVTSTYIVFTSHEILQVIWRGFKVCRRMSLGYTMPSWNRHLRICGLWCLWGSWSQSPADIREHLHIFLMYWYCPGLAQLWWSSWYSYTVTGGQAGDIRSLKSFFFLF
jgi:hypothetical protein